MKREENEAFKQLSGLALTTKEFSHDGERRSYFVLPRSANLSLTGFIGHWDGHYFLSEDVPEEYRTFQIIHEVIEVEELKEADGSCLEALNRELLLIPEEIKEDYISYRKNFFKNLVAFINDPKNKQERSRIIRITESYQYFLDNH